MTSIIFMGTPQFAVPILNALAENGYDILAAVTQPDKPVGRKHTLHASPVKVAAQALGVPVFQPVKLGKSPELDELIAMQPDLIVTAAYGQFLPTRFLDAARITAVNVHGSLLPKYRGGAPIQYSIINGDAETGVTIIQMVKQMDAGGMYAQASIPLTRADDTGTAFDRLSVLGRDLLLQTLPGIIDGTATMTPQDPERVTFSPNISKDQERLDFTLTATEIDQWVRGLRPHVGGWVMLNGQRVKLWAVTPLDTATEAAPGTVVSVGKKELVLAAGQGTTLQLDELQPAGKARQPISAYMNGAGRQLKVGQQVIIDGQE